MPETPSDMEKACEFRLSCEAPQASSPEERLLRTCSEVFASMFLSMRACISREKARQAAFLRDNGLPKSTKIPYEPQPMTEREESAVSLSLSVSEAMFGPELAEYAESHLRHAIETGDMRSFKIRLLFLKARDSIAGSGSRRRFSEQLDKWISESEEKAGCKPDMSPRRMSRFEKDRKARLESERKRKAMVQPELPLSWPQKDGTNVASGNGESLVILDSSQYIEKNPNFSISINIEKDKSIERTKPNKVGGEPVTVTNRGKNGIAHGLADDEGIAELGNGYCVRKARDYVSVDEILEDISSGKIVPYESAAEICADLKSGKITPVEAMMFTSALSSYAPFEQADSDEESEKEMEHDFAETGEDYEEYEEGEVYEDDEGEEEDAAEEERPRRGSGRASFSYNPNGFGGAEWNCEEDW